MAKTITYNNKSTAANGGYQSHSVGDATQNGKTSATGWTVRATSAVTARDLFADTSVAGAYEAFWVARGQIGKIAGLTFNISTATGAINETIKLKTAKALRLGIGFKTLALDPASGSGSLLKKL